MLRMDTAPAIETHIINGGGAVGGAGEPATPVLNLCRSLLKVSFKLTELAMYAAIIGSANNDPQHLDLDLWAFYQAGE